MTSRKHPSAGFWLIVSLVVVLVSYPLAEVKSDEPAKAPTPAADPTRRKQAGEVRDDNGLRMKLVWCSAGTFMNDSDRRGNKGQVNVTLTKGFWLGRYEVTQSEWKQVMMTEPWKDKRFTEDEIELSKEGDAFPATFVSWEDATQFCQKLTDEERRAGRLRDGWEYTLPTEAQWEYACRAGTKTEFHFGDDESKLGEYAWFDDNVVDPGEFYAHEVGRKKPNSWGLYDMYGNVSEWCRDSFDHRFRGGRDPEVKKRHGQYKCRVVRGGGWGASAKFCQSSHHWGGEQESRRSNLGFRVALSAVVPGKPANSEGEPSGTDK